MEQKDRLFDRRIIGLNSPSVENYTKQVWSLRLDVTPLQWKKRAPTKFEHKRGAGAYNRDGSKVFVFGGSWQLKSEVRAKHLADEVGGDG